MKTSCIINYYGCVDLIQLNSQERQEVRLQTFLLLCRRNTRVQHNITVISGSTTKAKYCFESLLGLLDLNNPTSTISQGINSSFLLFKSSPPATPSICTPPPPLSPPSFILSLCSGPSLPLSPARPFALANQVLAV